PGIRRPDLDDAAHRHEAAAGPGLDVAPELVGAPHQRHVGWVLVVAKPDDAGEPVRGAVVVSGREALDPDDMTAAPCQGMKGGAPHDAKPDDSDIEFCHYNGLFPCDGS